MERFGWCNWARSQCSSAKVVEPRDLCELKAVVRRAAESGSRIRASGGSYSWSELVPVSERDVIVSTRGLDRLLDMNLNEGTVTVECGMTIERLTELTAGCGWTVFTPTIFPKPTVGGVIAVGAHGTDINRGCFSDQICEMTLIGPDGRERTVARGQREFPAAQVALGALGIVYSVKLEIEKDFSVYVDERQVPVRYVLEEFEDLVRSYDFIEVFWYPLQGYMWLLLMHRSSSRPDRPSLLSQGLAELQDQLELVAGEVVLPFIVRSAPGFTPALARAASALGREVRQSVQTASQAFHFQRTYVRNWDLAYAVPLEQGARAWSDAIELIEEYARADRYPINLAVHSRFIGKSNAWLAPNYGQECCCIEAVTAIDTRDYESFFGELEGRWHAIDKARPHWAKVYGRTSSIKARYDRMEEFLEVRQEWDPKRVFLNRFLEKDIFQL